MNMKLKDNLFYKLGDIIDAYLTPDDQLLFKKLIDEKVEKEYKLLLEQNMDIDNYSVEDERLIAHRRFQIETLITELEPKLDEPLFLDVLINLSLTLFGLGEITYAEDLLTNVLRRCSANSLFKDFRADALVSLGEIKFRQAKWEQGELHIKEAIQIYESQKKYSGLARCENWLGIAAGDRGKIHEAKEHFINAQQNLEYSEDLILSAYVLQNLSIVNIMMRNYDEAITGLNRALQVFTELNYDKPIAYIRYNLGLVFLRQQKYSDSIKEIEMALQHAKVSEFLPPFSISYLNKSNIYLEKDDLSLSLAFAEKSEEISYKINDRLTIADIYKVRGQIYAKLGESKLAEKHFLTSLRMNKELDNQENYAETSLELGHFYKNENRLAEAKKHYLAALEYQKHIGVKSAIEEIEGYLTQS